MRKLMVALVATLVAGVAFSSAVTDAVLSSVRMRPAAVKRAAQGARMLLSAPKDDGCEVTLAFTGEEDVVFPVAVVRGTVFEFDFVGDAEMVPLHYVVHDVATGTETRCETPEDGHYVVTIESKTIIEVICRRPLYVDRDAANLTARNKSTGYYPTNALESIQEAVDLALDGAEVRVRGGYSYAPFCVTNRELKVTSDLRNPAIVDGAGNARCVEVVEAVSNETTQAFDYLPAGNGLTVVSGFTLTNGCSATDGGAVWGGTYVACRIADSRANGSGGGIWGAEARNCLITGCEATVGAAAAECTLKNCTVTANVGGSDGVVENTKCYNSIVFGNGTGKQIGDSCESLATFTVGVVFGDGYHLRMNSTGIFGGLQDFVDDALDLDGLPRRDGVRVTAGCFQTAQACTDAVGVTVDGQDLSFGGGEGWTYDPVLSNLTITASGLYTLAGAATGVSVRVTADAGLFLDGLCLRGAPGAVLSAADDHTLTLAGGTGVLDGATDVSGKVVISGGCISLNGKAFADARNVLDSRVYGVEIEGFAGAIRQIGLEGYETRGMRAIDGRLCLWLPKGVSKFKVIDEAHPKGVEVLCYVDEDTVYGEIYGDSLLPVGLTVDGADISSLAGQDWVYFPGSGSLLLLAARDYTLSGAATGEVRLCVRSDAGVTFDQARLTSTTGPALVVLQGATLTVRGGTAELSGTEAIPGRVVIAGGSLFVNAAFETRPENPAGQGLFAVEADVSALGLTGETLNFWRLDGYETAGIRPVGGKICLWRPEGCGWFLAYGDGACETGLVCDYAVGPEECQVKVSHMQTGVKVNGLDVGFREDVGWRYDWTNHCVEVTEPGEYVLSGTNTAGEVIFSINADATVTLSDLCLKCTATNGSCLCVSNGVDVTLQLAGINTLEAQGPEADAIWGEGLRVENGSHLTIRSAPGLVDKEAVLIAKGSGGGAAIALAQNSTGNLRPVLEIAGGVIKAEGGWNAAGIGGGVEARYGNVLVSGGTVFVKGGGDADDMLGGFNGKGGGDFHVTGGSIVLANNRLSPRPMNATGHILWGVTVTNLTPHAAVAVMGLDGYGKQDIFADVDGKICLWLPDGGYRFGVDGDCYEAIVEGAEVTAERASETGVRIDGRDVAFGGEGWHYDLRTHTVEVTETGEYVLSGTNTAGEVLFAINADATVTLSNLCLWCTAKETCCLWATNNVTVMLQLAGTNTLDACHVGERPYEFAEGICVENGSHLMIRAALGLADEEAVLIVNGGGDGAAIDVSRNGPEGPKPVVEISSGTICANWIEDPSSYSVGIGGSSRTGRNGDADIRITGGHVYAKGGWGSPAIGASGALNDGSVDIFVSGGVIKAEGGWNAAGIGSGNQSRYGNVTITGGTIFVSGSGSNVDDMLDGYNGRPGGDFHVTGGSIVLANDRVYPRPKNADEQDLWCVTVTNLTPNAAVAVTGPGDYGTADIFADADGKICLWLPNGTCSFVVGDTAYRATVSNRSVNAEIASSQVVSYLDWTKSGMQLKWAEPVPLQSGANQVLHDGWYVVDGEVMTTNLQISGTVHLILADGSTLTAQGDYDGHPGVGVNADCSLFIYGQKGGTGRLVATGGTKAAGIGSDDSGPGDGKRGTCGAVTINGGRIEATGSSYGAGIGGSNYLYWGSWGHGGRITVNGGWIKATAFDKASSIGGSAFGNGGEVVLRGGTVETSDTGYSGVGGGGGGVGNPPGAPGSLTITGGSLLPNKIGPQPTNADGLPVYCVTVDGMPPGRIVVTGLENYGVHDIYSLDGKIYLWLPDGTYLFNLGGERYHAIVAGEATMAERTYQTGVTINGQEAGFGPGRGWRYDDEARRVEVTEPGEYVLSGTNTAGEVMFSIAADAMVTLSNLCLRCTTKGGRCLWTENGADVTLLLAGTNALEARGVAASDEMGDGIGIGNGARLTVRAAPGFADEEAVLIASGGKNRAAIAVGRNGSEGERPFFEIAGGTVYANWMEEPANYCVGIGVSYQTGWNADATVRISGGRVYAKGGYHVAGIGAAAHADMKAPDIRITGGYVEAVGGENGAAIGGSLGSRSGEVTIGGGTVRATGGVRAADMLAGHQFVTSGALRVTGGSVEMTRLGEDLGVANPNPWPTNAVGQALWCVTVPNLTPGAAVAVTGLDGYGVQDIFADAEGKISLWLQNGHHAFAVDGETYFLRVKGAHVTAHPMPPTGVTVNGKDAAFGEDKGWTYDSATRTLALTNAAEYVLAGTNTSGAVKIAVEADATLKVDGLCLAAETGSCLRTADGTSVTLALVGTNTLDVSSNGEGIRLGDGAKLTVEKAGGATGGVELRAKGANGTAGIVGGAGAAVTVRNGTVSRIGAGVALTVKGGSIVADATVAATDAAGVSVHCVTVEGLSGLVRFENLGDYGTDGIVADADGRVYLWLPDGSWMFNANGRYYHALVSGASATAQAYGQEAAGLCVNGISVLYGPRTGWSYDVYARRLTLDGRLDGYALTGTNDEIEVVADGTFELTLCSSAFGSLSATTNANVRLYFDGRGCGIGDVRLPDDPGTLEITGGTAVIGAVTGEEGRTLRISGGSIEFEREPEGIVLTNAGMLPLLRTAIALPENCPEGQPVRVEGLGAYDVSGLYPRNRCLCLWLPDHVSLADTTYITVNGWYYCLKAGRNPDETIGWVTTGFTVNGRDLGEAQGPGWAYDIHFGELLFADAVVTNVLYCTNNAASYAVVPTAAMNIAAKICGTLDWSAPERRFEGAFVIVGGNILASSRQFSVRPTNGAEPVYAVRLTLPEDVRPDERIQLTGLADYIDRNMYAIGREVCLWLPDGEHAFTVNGARCRAVVSGKDTRAEYCETGVLVDGVDCSEMAGEGWTWSPVSKELALVGAHQLDSLPAADLPDTVRLVCGEGAEIVGGTSDLSADQVVGGLVIKGGSHRFDGTFAVPPSNGVARVWRVDVEVPYDFAEGDEVPISYENYSGAGVRVRDGQISLWLPETRYGVLVVDGVLYTVRIVDGAGTAKPVTAGVRVNGDDIGLGRRPGWSWDYRTRKLQVTGELDNYEFTVDGESHIAHTEVAASTTVTLSNAVIQVEAGASAFTAATNVVMTLRFKGGHNAIVGERGESGAKSGQPLAGEGAHVVAGGTAAIVGPVASRLEIDGGSLFVGTPEDLPRQPVNFRGDAVYRVAVPMPRLKDRNRALTVAGLPAYYDVSEIYPSDGEVAGEPGMICFWLPVGSYNFTVEGFGFTATVTGEGWTEAEFCRSYVGVLVNGVDCSYGEDTGWEWSAVNDTLYLSGACDYLISGANTNGWVSIAVTNTTRATQVLLDDLQIGGLGGGASAIDIRPGAELMLGLVGDLDDEGPVLVGAPGRYNTGDASARGGAGIHVPPGAKLTVGGLFTGDTDPRSVLTVVGGRLAAGIGGTANEAMGEVTVLDHTLRVSGGDRAAGIGGGSGGDGGQFNMFGGEVYAFGGDGIDGSAGRDDLGGAGIGGGWGGAGGQVTVAGGIISALGGAGGAVIGGGAGGDGGELQILAGTVYPYPAESTVLGASVFGGGSGGADGVNLFCGGSIAVTNGAIRAAASNGTERVTLVPIELPHEEEDAPGYVSQFVRAQIEGLPPDYGTHDIFTYEGFVYLWLPDGTYDFTMDDIAYSVKVEDGVVTEDHYRLTGVTVNGRDICYAKGPGWTWNPATFELALAGDTEFVVSGEAERSNVWVNAFGAARVVLSNFTAAASIALPLQAAAGSPSFRFAGEPGRFAAIGGEGTAVVAGGNVAFGSIPQEAKVVVAGGNVTVEGSFPTNKVTNAAGRPVVPVGLNLIEGCAPDSTVKVLGLPDGYDTEGVRAVDGWVCFWLPYGDYEVDLTGLDAEGEAHTRSLQIDVFDFGFNDTALESIIIQDEDGEDVVIPRSWVQNYDLVDSDASTEEYVAAVLMPSANAGIPVWKSFIAGLDPTDPDQTFYAVIELVDGNRVSVGPNAMQPHRVYKVVASADLSFTKTESFAVGASGRIVLERTREKLFFKVKVGLE